MTNRDHEVLLKCISDGIAQQVQRGDAVKGPRERLEAREMHACTLRRSVLRPRAARTFSTHLRGEFFAEYRICNVHACETQALLPALRARGYDGACQLPKKRAASQPCGCASFWRRDRLQPEAQCHSSRALASYARAAASSFL